MTAFLKYKWWLLFILLAGGIVFFIQKESGRYNLTHLVYPPKNLQQPALAALIPPGAPIKVQIDKGDYTLQIFTSDTLVKTYPVVFGGNPVDDKLRQGDQCTPEGVFKMRAKYPHKSWSKFIWIDYPTTASWQKHRQAKKDGLIPQHAKIGGEIGVHGVPEGKDFTIDRRINWTLGCISLKNEDINEIYPFFNDKTTIVIQK